MPSYLDKTGLQIVWNKIKAQLDTKANNSSVENLETHTGLGKTFHENELIVASTQGGEFEGSGIDISTITGLEQASTRHDQEIEGKQDTLVSGTNIKTINNTTLLGSGNISITKSTVGLGNVLNVASYSKEETDTLLSNLETSINTIIANAPEEYNTLKEISDYIASDKSGASSMLSSINSNTSRIKVLEENGAAITSITEAELDEMLV